MFLTPEDAWAATQGQLQLQLHQATYNTWVRDANFVSYENGVFTIAVNNAYAKDWLEQRVARLIQHSISNVISENVTLRVVVQPPKKPERKQPAPLFDDDFSLPAKNVEGSSKSRTKPPVSLKTEVIEPKPAITFAQGEQLNADYTLQNFVVGSCNQMAHVAATAITHAKGTLYNPLFVHGGVGLGKTHLIQAIGNAFQAQGRKVLYFSAETFTNDLVRAIRLKEMDAFREFYRSHDVLIVDDVQFIAGKDSTQQEFFHTFNALHNQSRTIILAADHKPNAIEGLEARLSSRFEAGLVIELTRPDYDTRTAILTAKAQAQEMDMSSEVAQMLARRGSDNIRNLEGYLNQVLAQSALTRQPITPQLVNQVMREGGSQQKPLEIEDIFAASARYHQLSLDDLLSKQRNQEVVRARHIAIYLVRQEMKMSLPAIGRALGGLSHSTVINGYRKVEALLENDPAFRQEVQQVRQTLYKEL